MVCLIFPAAAQAQDDRDLARAYFADTLSLNWTARDADTAIAGIEQSGVELDVFFPSDEGIMYLLSEKASVQQADDLMFSRLYSVVTCPGSETHVEYMRFFHSGARDPLIDAILKSTQATGLMVNDPERADRNPGFIMQKFNVSPSTETEGISILTAVGTLQNGAELINYEAVLTFPCIGAVSQ